MKISLTLIFLLGGLQFLFSQSQPYMYQLSAKTLDRQNQEPIPYVNIGILNSAKGTVSDAQGKFALKSIQLTDTLIVSSLGYQTQKVSVKNVDEKSPIYLESIGYEIETIEVSDEEFDKSVLLGAKNEKGRGSSFGFGSPQLGTEIGAPIKIDQETFIKSVHFVLNHAKGDSLLFRINIYAFDKGKIGEKILRENIYLVDKQRKGEYSIDLSNYSIILKEDVLLSLEWLRDFDEIGNKAITFDTKKTKSPKGTYIRFSSNGPFKKWGYKKKLKPCIYFMGKQSSRK